MLSLDDWVYKAFQVFLHFFVIVIHNFWLFQCLSIFLGSDFQSFTVCMSPTHIQHRPENQISLLGKAEVN